MSSIMASTTSASAPSLSHPASASLPPRCALLSLPTALLSHVCTFLSPKELLITLAHAAKTARALLTPACSSSHPLVLGSYELSVLSTFSPPWSLSLRPFHSRVLSHCHLSLRLESEDVGMQQVLDSLDHFPACGAISLSGQQWLDLRDSELYSFLHHPTVLTCDHLALAGFTRPKAESVPVGSELSREDVRLSRLKRKRDVALAVSSRKRPFDWADIRLPHTTRLRIQLLGNRLYTGGAQFLTAHTALVELDVSTLLASVDDLADILRHSAALPHLARFGLHDHRSMRETVIYDLSPLVAALTTTRVSSGSVRPIESLTIDQATTNDVLGAVADVRGLTHLQVNRARLGWLQQWAEMEEVMSMRNERAVPLLESFIVHEHDNMGAELTSVKDMTRFLRSMASRPLKRLSICTGERITFDEAAMSQLARCHQLRELFIDVGIEEASACVNWMDAALFTSFSPRHFSCLRIVKLRRVRLSAEAVVSITAAAPALRHLSIGEYDSVSHLSCHSAVVCAIVGGYCEHIECVTVNDAIGHVWSTVQTADVVGAYQSAVAAAGRGDAYRPFVQLRHLHTEMCWCTPPAVWHALLSLMKYATHARCVARLASNDALVVSALAHLPSITSLTCESQWPASFATLMEQRSEQTGQYRFVACQQLTRDDWHSCPADVFELTDTPNEGSDAIPLQPHSDLFAAYQRSLTADQQAVLARWAAGDFQAGDGLITAAESPSEQCDDAALPAAERRCAHPHRLSSVEISRVANYDKTSEAEEEEVAEEAGGSGVDQDQSYHSFNTGESSEASGEDGPAHEAQECEDDKKRDEPLQRAK